MVNWWEDNLDKCGECTLHSARTTLLVARMYVERCRRRRRCHCIIRIVGDNRRRRDSSSKFRKRLY